MTVAATGEVFVHVARSLLFEGKILTLVDLAPSTIWLSLTPPSGLGYVATGAFLDLWDERAHRSDAAAHPAIGRLALLNPDAQLAGQALLALNNPRMTSPGLAYDAEVIEGLVPAASGACVLFLEWDGPTTRAQVQPPWPRHHGEGPPQ